MKQVRLRAACAEARGGVRSSTHTGLLALPGAPPWRGSHSGHFCGTPAVPRSTGRKDALCGEGDTEELKWSCSRARTPVRKLGQGTSEGDRLEENPGSQESGEEMVANVQKVKQVI